MSISHEKDSHGNDRFRVRISIDQQRVGGGSYTTRKEAEDVQAAIRADLKDLQAMEDHFESEFEDIRFKEIPLRPWEPTYTVGPQKTSRWDRIKAWLKPKER